MQLVQQVTRCEGLEGHEGHKALEEVTDELLLQSRKEFKDTIAAKLVQRVEDKDKDMPQTPPASRTHKPKDLSLNQLHQPLAFFSGRR